MIACSYCEESIRNVLPVVRTVYGAEHWFCSEECADAYERDIRNDPDEPSDKRERRAALAALLGENMDLAGECSRCETPKVLGLVLGEPEEGFAVGVTACPNCGMGLTVHSYAEEGGVTTNHRWKHMWRIAHRWLPPWRPPESDLRSDWRCSCGRIFHESDEAYIHAYMEHPDSVRMDMVDHDRYPWSKLEAEP